MSAPIGKGSRFLVLSGKHRLQEVTVTDGPTGSGGCIVRVGQTDGFGADIDALSGPNFKRLADAPPEVDPLLAEIDALARAVDMEAIGQAGGVADAIRDALNGETEEEDDEDWFASRRLLFADIAGQALAGMRAIDGRRKP